jgi:hypothetical protein
MLNELDYMYAVTGRLDIPPPSKLINHERCGEIEMKWVFWEWEVPDCPPDDTWPGLFLGLEVTLGYEGDVTFSMSDYCQAEHAESVDLDLWVSRFLRIQKDGWWLETGYGSDTRSGYGHNGDVAQKVRDILGLS